MEWSIYQQDIFNFVKRSTKSALIQAVAGSGKTTTIVEATKHAQGQVVFLAFNKSIATELKQRKVNARTFHSLSYGAVLRHRNVKEVCGNKTNELVRKHFSSKAAYIYGSFLDKAISLAKAEGVGCLVPDEPSIWYHLIDKHGLTFESDEPDASIEQAVELCSKTLKLSNESREIDFDDMLYVPVREGLSLPKFDVIFVDEVQDTNAIQRAILRKIMKSNSRIIGVGDRSQAIYGFRGADSNAMDLLAEEFDCVQFPLSVSYRCAENVVIAAREYCNHIECSDNAKLGSVQSLGTKWTTENFRAGDLVVCRTTRPIVSLAFKMLKEGKPVYVYGRSLSQGLTSLIKKFKTNNLEDLEAKLGMWSRAEIEKAVAQQNDAKAEAIYDKVETIKCLTQSLDEGADVAQLLTVIDELFREKSHCTMLSTIHKAKGLEAETVYWLNASECPSPWARQAWQREQEINLCYVAVTRAKTNLIKIEME